MYQVLAVIITALSVIFWVIQNKFLYKKIDKNICCLIYIVVFNLVAVICGKSALGVPDFSSGIFIIDIIIACILYIIMITYIPIRKYESKSDTVYYNIIQPIAQDVVLLGVVIPFLFGIKVLYTGYFLSIVYISGGIAIAMICCGIAIWFNMENIDLLEFICKLIITFMHAQILIITSSVWLLIILRFIYYFMIKHKEKKSNNY